MTNSAPVVVAALRVVRGGRPVLPHVDAELPAGVITGLLGPSGSGKSTLMRAVVGVQAVTSGTVTVLGHPAGSPPLRRLVGYSTQAPAVYPDLTVRENLRYFASVRGDDPRDVDRVLGLVGLTRYADRLAGQLSGGELGRASLAVALLGQPRLLVLDEPTVGLDPVLRTELWEQFHRLAAEGVTMLVSSHVMDEAGRCDQLLLMREGAVLAQDTPDALRRRTGTDDIALLGTALGLAVSAFARSEFQAVQFLPVVVLPQVLLCGLFVPRGQMARLLQWLSDALPLTYAVDAMARVTRTGSADGELWRDVAVVFGASLLALALGAATLRRRTP